MEKVEGKGAGLEAREEEGEGGRVEGEGGRVEGEGGGG